MISPLNIKLGTSKKGGFYHIDVEKEYTQIQKGRMPELVLQILVDLQKEFPGNFTGFCCKNFVSHRLMRTEIGEELKFDEYGYQVSLNSLLKDFLNAGLIEGKVRMNDWSVVKITSLGEKFLQLNVID